MNRKVVRTTEIVVDDREIKQLNVKEIDDRGLFIAVSRHMPQDHVEGKSHRRLMLYYFSYPGIDDRTMYRWGTLTDIPYNGKSVHGPVHVAILEVTTEVK